VTEKRLRPSYFLLGGLIVIVLAALFYALPLVRCPECEGGPFLAPNSPEDPTPEMRVCMVCGGRGRIPVFLKMFPRRGMSKG
jgi:hypothetical protein